MTYRNDNAQLDTFYRLLPKTDDPAECIEHLMAWWKSKRKAQAVLAGEEVYDAEKSVEWNELIAGCVKTEDERAIETLLDALSGKESA